MWKCEKVTLIILNHNPNCMWLFLPMRRNVLGYVRTYDTYKLAVFLKAIWDKFGEGKTKWSIRNSGFQMNNKVGWMFSTNGFDDIWCSARLNYKYPNSKYSNHMCILEMILIFQSIQSSLYWESMVDLQILSKTFWTVSRLGTILSHPIQWLHE